MSMRVGHILRYEDVHGVSGDDPEGEVVAEVTEFSNGKVVVAWQSKAPSVNVYDNVKYVETNHGHGGKSEIVWIWQSPPDPDPMEKVFERKIREAGGQPPKNGLNDQIIRDVAEAAAEDAADEIQKLLVAKAAEKLVERARETGEAGKKEGEKKPVAKKKAAANKPTNGKKK